MAIRIDAFELTHAMEAHDTEWVLDRETGKVLMAEWLRDPSLVGDLELGIDADEDDDEALLESGRFAFIDAVPSYERFRWMERFAAGVEDAAVRESLLDALDRPKPFRRFKDALPPGVRDAWFQYEDEQLRESARAWLGAEGIDAELVDPSPPEQPP